jgi:excisionase family DNA binding protein
MSIHEFNAMPEIIPYKRVRALTGLDRETVRELARRGVIREWRTPGGHARYYRADLPKLGITVGAR